MADGQQEVGGTEQPSSINHQPSTAPRAHISVRPLRAAEMPELLRAAGDDGHAVRGATHGVFKDGHIIGCLSFTHHVAMVQVWMSTSDAGPLDSLEMIAAAKAIAAEHGNSAVLVPCKPDSPYHEKLPKLGFTPLPGYTFHVKSL